MDTFTLLLLYFTYLLLFIYHTLAFCSIDYQLSANRSDTSIADGAGHPLFEATCNKYTYAQGLLQG